LQLLYRTFWPSPSFLARQGNLWVDMESFGALMEYLQGAEYCARHGQVT